MNTLRPLFAACGLLLFLSVEGNCEIIQAQSPEQQDVQAAVDAAHEGDTVTIPDGSATWDSTITISKPLTIIGAGKGETIINLNYVNGFEVNGVLGKFYRISGLTFRGNCLNDSNNGGFIVVYGTSQTWRVDNIHFESTAGVSRTAMVKVNGYTYGVIDHCDVTGPFAVHPFVIVLESYGVEPRDGGSRSWKRPLSLGTADAVYIEKNEIKYDTYVVTSDNPVIDAAAGSRYVFRYNNVKNDQIGGHGPQTLAARGQYSWEVYENNFEFTSSVWCPVKFRGGTGVVYNNRFTANNINEGAICLQYYRSGGTGSGEPWVNSCDDTPEYMCNYFKGGGIQGVPMACPDFNCPPDQGPCIRIDGDIDGTGYPCRDGIGMTYNGVDDIVQTSSPACAWGNTCTGNCGDAGPNPVFVRHEGSDAHHLLDRDYFNESPKPGYAAYTYPHPLTTMDTVTIVRVIYAPARKALYVLATSSAQPNVTLTATGRGQLIYSAGQLNYSRTFMNVKTKPAAITVTSSAGGSATFTLP